jgi:hypothetical protein
MPRRRTSARSAFKRQEKGYTVQKGFEVPRLISPAPLDPKSELVTVSATLNGRPAPQFNGVINYWTRRKSDDQQQAKSTTGGESRGQERSQDDGKRGNSWGWVKPVAGVATVVAGAALLTATIGEDVLTGGVGIADDAVTVPAAVAMMRAGASAL